MDEIIIQSSRDLHDQAGLLTRFAQMLVGLRDIGEGYNGRVDSWQFDGASSAAAGVDAGRTDRHPTEMVKQAV